ncbi:MAG: transposase [Verrucomicrobiota bacterium]
MNDDTKSSPGAVESPLHLNKFAHRSAGETDPVVPGSESQTIFIKKTAEESAAHLPQAAPGEDDAFGLPIKDMLGVITYCYVRGVFSSKEIAEKLKQDPELRKSFGKHLPDEADIKAFRRSYAAEIEDLLETVFRAFPPNASKTDGAQGVGQTEIVHREAVDRLHDANWEDSMRRHLH